MPISIVEAKDCLPFFKKQKTEIIPLTPKDQNLHESMRRLCEYWYDVQSKRDADEEPIVSLQPRNYKGETALWWAGRYIGIAHLSIGKQKVEISIRPRFGENFLLALVEDVYNIKSPIQDAEDRIENSNEWFSALLQILRRKIWIDKCAKANRYGLPRRTVKHEHKGVALHGAIDVRRTIRSWLFDQEVCTFTYEKEMDSQIGKILYEANKILSKDAIKFQEKKDSKKSVLGFTVPPVVRDTIDLLNSRYKSTIFDIRENDYKRIRYKSIYQSWKPLVDYSWAIIRGKQLSFKASDSITNCIFIDMAEIWEAFLRKKLGENERLREDGWRVLSVEECKLNIYESTFYERKIIPDIILQNGEKFMVFDAKYKRMRGLNEDVDRTDLFQIHTYIQYVERCMGKVVLAGLLYPITGDKVNENTYHSDNLFGHSNGKKIPFIIDGIYCDEVDNDIDKSSIESKQKEIEENVASMIARIRTALRNS